MNFENLIYILFISSLILQLFYRLYFNSRLLFLKSKSKIKDHPISVIICARNEVENLRKNLTQIFTQKYQNFEVIVVNDRSWDKSIEFLEKLKENEARLRIVNIPDNQTDHFGKKLAITLGIKAAKYNHLLFTDADCFPLSEFWIQEMSNGLDEEHQIVLGAGIYKKKKGLLNKLIRYDTAFIALNYLSFAKARIPYMGVGRNLGYSQEIYYLNNGFKSHYHLASGDDDLLVNQAANQKNTTVILNSNSLTISKAKTTWKSWIYQKKRHHTTNINYKKRDKAILGLQYIASLLFYLSSLLLLFSSLRTIVLILFLVNYFISIFIFYKPFKTLMCKDLLWVYPFYEFILLICQPIFQIKNKNSI